MEGADTKQVCFHFDQKLRAVLDDIPPEILDCFSSVEFDEIQKGQRQLRKYLTENRSRLSIASDERFQNADFLVFALLAISDNEKYKTMKELRDDLAHPMLNGHIRQASQIAQSEHHNCACCHNIYNIWVYTNPHTKRRLHLGNVCINMSFITSKEERKQLRDGFKIKCETCEEKTVKTDSFGKVYDCTKCSKTFRKCEMCGLYKVDKDADKSRVNCNSCKVVLRYFRKCKTCGLYNIKTSDPSWKVDCLDCWKKSKNIENKSKSKLKKCIKCGEYRCSGDIICESFGVGGTCRGCLHPEIRFFCSDYW